MPVLGTEREYIILGDILIVFSGRLHARDLRSPCILIPADLTHSLSLNCSGDHVRMSWGIPWRLWRQVRGVITSKTWFSHSDTAKWVGVRAQPAGMSRKQAGTRRLQDEMTYEL